MITDVTVQSQHYPYIMIHAQHIFLANHVTFLD